MGSVCRQEQMTVSPQNERGGVRSMTDDMTTAHKLTVRFLLFDAGYSDIELPSVMSCSVLQIDCNLNFELEAMA